MLRNRRFSVLTLCLVFLASTPLAQQSDRAGALDEQIGRIFQSVEYQAPRFGPARWLPDGTAYSIVERAADRAEVSDIVRYDAATGARSVLLAGTALIPAR